MKILFLNILLLLNLSIVYSQKHSSDSKINKVDLSVLSTKVDESKLRECLQPATSVLNNDDFEIGYLLKLKKNLFKDLPNNFTTRFLVRPSFQPEKVLLIDNEYIYYNIAEKSIWKEWSKEVKDSPTKVLDFKSEVSVHKFQNKINDKDRKLIQDLFKVATSKVCYQTFNSVSVDGTIYSFSYSKFQEGISHSPGSNTLINSLISINKAIINIITTTEGQEEINIPEDLALEIIDITQKFKTID